MDHRRRWRRVYHLWRRLHDRCRVHLRFRCTDGSRSRSVDDRRRQCLHRRWNMPNRSLHRRRDMLRLYRTRCSRDRMNLWDNRLARRRLRSGDRWLHGMRDRAGTRDRSSMLDGWGTNTSRRRWRVQQWRFGWLRRMDLRDERLNRRRPRGGDRWLRAMRDRARGCGRSGMLDGGGADMSRRQWLAQHRGSGRRRRMDRGSGRTSVLHRRVQRGRNGMRRHWYAANCWPRRYWARGRCGCRQVELPCDNRRHANGGGARAHRLRSDQGPCLCKLRRVNPLGKTADRT
jgi:hypothetical protein